MLSQITLGDTAIGFFESIKETFLSLSKTMQLAMSRIDFDSVSWVRLYYECAVKEKGRIRFKVDSKVTEFVKRIKAMLMKVGIRPSSSTVVHMVLRAAFVDEDLRVFTANVQGYKAKPSDLDRRMEQLAGKINEILPDIVMLQEFRTDEDLKRVETLNRRCCLDYVPVLPKEYDPETDYDHCICMALVRHDLATDIRIRDLRLNAQDAADCRLRANYFDVGSRTFINAWIPQTCGVSEERTKLASDMWMALLKEIRVQAGREKQFYLMGDLNSYKDGAFAQNLSEAGTMLIDTKDEDSIRKPTRGGHILDYAFANNNAYRKGVTTSIVDMNGISDHNALLTRIGC